MEATRGLRPTAKIVGVGLNKTGTTTLGVCMRAWKFRHVGNNREAFEMYRRGESYALIEFVRRFDSFEDWPWPLVYKEIDRDFPESKFILTKRSSPEVWFESLCRHAEKTGPTGFREHVYGRAMPDGHKEEHIARYEEHNAEVERYFRNRPNSLLVVCWEEGDGWEKLGRFLGREPPNIPFPHANKSGGVQLRHTKRLVRSWMGRERYACLARVKEAAVLLWHSGRGK